jgi:hypothetical protein
MKNILTTAGMAAAAVVGFHTTCAAQTVTVDDSKWWQVGAALRGFYDDNYTTSASNEQESFGIEIRPEFTVGHQGEQHLIQLKTIYSARWFEDREDEEWDHGVSVDLAGEYRVTENHVLRLNNLFSYTDEGPLLDEGGLVSTPLRSEESNIRNLANARYIGQYTPLFGLEVGYQNTYYSYDQEGIGSYSALLDRTEHLIRAETRWTITPTLAGILGYWYEDVGFNGDDDVSLFFPGVEGDIRDSHSHFIVGGVDYTVSPHCFVSVRGGAQNVIYDNLPGEPDEWNPFADVNTTFEYLEGSYFRLGAKYGRTRTDMLSIVAVDSVTLDQEAFTVYGMVDHKLMENLTARASGQLQFGEFEGGGFDGEKEGLYLAGISLVYDLSQYLALEGGYSYDRLDSDDNSRSYTRNRLFLGVRGQF